MQIFERSAWFTEQVYPETILATKKNLSSSITGNIVLALMSVWLLHTDTPTIVLLSWLLLNLSLSAIRVVIVRRLQPDLDTPSIRTDILIYILTIFALGLSWGTLSIIASLYSAPIEHLFITIIIAGISAGAIATISPIFTAFKGYFTLAVFPVFISFLLSPHPFIQHASPVVLFYIFIIYSSGKLLYQTLLKTIELKTQEQQLNHSLMLEKARAEQANQSKTRFLSSMSHEFKTPLNAIMGFSQLLKMNETLSADDMDNIEQIDIASQQLLVLLDNVLKLSDVMTDDANITIQSVSLLHTLTQVKEAIADINNGKAIKISTPTADHKLLADPLYLHQVLLQLLSYLIQSHYDGGTIDISVKHVNSHALRVYLKDKATDMPYKLETDIFTSINKLDAKSTNIVDTGIGLFFAKVLIEKMQGQIGFEHYNDTAVAFWFELPLADPKV